VSDWIDIPGETGDSYSLQAFIGYDGFQFRVKVTNVNGNSRTSNPATLNVTPYVGINIDKQPVSLTVESGKTATFSVGATGSGVLHYQWQKSTDGGYNFGNIPGATGNSHSFTAYYSSDNGDQFRVVVTDDIGSDTSEIVTLTVTPSEGGGPDPEEKGSMGCDAGFGALGLALALGALAFRRKRKA
jgi:hypothetical protein